MKKKPELIAFFDVTIMMSVRRVCPKFIKIFSNNSPLFARNGIEVLILVVNPDEDQKLKRIVEQNPFINFKIVVGHQLEKPINKGAFFNAGLKHASFKFVMILDPMIEMVTDVIYQLRRALFYYPQRYGKSLAYSDSQKAMKVSRKDVTNIPIIMATKEILFQIRGFDENIPGWEEVLCHLCRRLEMYGLRKHLLLDTEAVYFAKQSNERKLESTVNAIKLKKVLHPKEIVQINTNWGTDFVEVVWNWNYDKSKRQLKKYISSFQKEFVSNRRTCEDNYEIVALVQVRNEIKNIPEILLHLDQHCDGIILLDDGSTDNSYEKAVHDKLLVKVKKKYKGYFDDLENRNILLKISSFFKSKWFFFIDADERFDPRFSQIDKYIGNVQNDVIRFSLVDVWDNEDTYRADMPDRNKSGITTRARMFKNKGSLQIHSNREIHFPAVPFPESGQIANILLLHYGNFDAITRDRKYRLYVSQDPDGMKHGNTYEFLRDKNVSLKKIEEINL